MNEFITVVLDEAPYRHGSGIAQCADGAPLDVAGHAVELVDVLRTALAVLEAVHQAIQPARTLAARCALATALVRVEIRQALEAAHRAAGLVHDDDGPRTQHGAGLGDGVVVHGEVHHHVAGDDRRRRAARDDHLELAAIAHATGQLQQFGKGRAQRNLVVAGTLDIAADGEDLGAAVVGLARLEEGLPPVADDPGHGRESLGVVDGGGLAVQAEAGRERRLETRLAFLALQRFEQGRFFTTDVGAETVVGIEVEREVRTQDALAHVARRPRLRQGLLEALVDAEDLAVDVVVARRDAHRIGGDGHALDDDVRVVAQDVAILERAGLALVGVADQILLARELARHEAPLEPRGKACPTPPAQAGSLDLGDDLLGGHGRLAIGPQQDAPERLITAAGLVFLDAPVVGGRETREDLGIDVTAVEAGFLHAGVDLQIAIHVSDAPGLSVPRSARRASRCP